jgi:hypothetical protein
METNRGIRMRIDFIYAAAHEICAATIVHRMTKGFVLVEFDTEEQRAQFVEQMKLNYGNRVRYVFLPKDGRFVVIMQKRQYGD